MTYWSVTECRDVKAERQGAPQIFAPPPPDIWLCVITHSPRFSDLAISLNPIFEHNSNPFTIGRCTTWRTVNLIFEQNLKHLSTVHRTNLENSKAPQSSGTDDITGHFAQMWEMRLPPLLTTVQRNSLVQLMKYLSQTYSSTTDF